MLIHGWFHLLLLLCASSVHSVPPPSPIQCDLVNNTNCRLYNSYGVWNDRIDCPLSVIRYPKTEQEIRQIVAEANQNNLTLKVVSKFSHTIPKLSCPSSNSILISTSNYDTGIEVDVDNLSVTADSGVGLRDLINKVEAAGYSLVAAPYWEGVSIGGLISTGAHGSSWWGKGGAVHDHVVGISIVVAADENENFAKIITLRHDDHNPQLFNAAKLSIGLLGVISKVTLSIAHGFKRRITYKFQVSDEDLQDKFMTHAEENEFGDITWYPSQRTCVYRYDNRVDSSTPGDSKYEFLGFQANQILVTKLTRAAERLADESRNVKAKCQMASGFLAYKKWVGNGLSNNLLTPFTAYPAIGTQGNMQTSGSCLYSASYRIDSSCAWDPRYNGLSFYESTAIFPVASFSDFIRDVKKLRDLAPENFCGVDIYNGLLIRYIKASEAYLGQQEDSVVVDFNYYRADNASTPRLNEDVWEEVEQMAFFKHGAKPHWAKNRNLAFLNVKQKYPDFHKFFEAKQHLDPKDMFSNLFTDEIFSDHVAKKGDGCALEGQCVCSADRHCSPSNGYLCKRGLVYTEANVCRYSSTSSITSSRLDVP